jgi:hypothetical protein
MIDTRLVLKMVEDMLNQPWKVLQEKLTTSADYARVFLPQSSERFYRTQDIVQQTHDVLLMEKQQEDHLLQQEARLRQLRKLLGSWIYKLPFFRKKRQKAQQEFDKINKEFSDVRLSPSLPAHVNYLDYLVTTFMELMEVDDLGESQSNMLYGSLHRFLLQRIDLLLSASE